MNKTFLPLYNQEHTARRVLYIDGEATQAEMHHDMKKMLESCSPEERQLVRDNLRFICDEELNYESLDLANPRHLRIVMDKAIEVKPDVIIVDTLSALTVLEDENDNAKIKNEVIQPLKNLARKSSCGVMLLHHTGKFNEGSANLIDAAYRGRGASALGALSRVVLNLTKGTKDLAGKVILSCSKVKGEKFDPIILQLDRTSRWFKKIETEVEVAQPVSKTDRNYEKVVNFVKKTKRKVETNEIVAAFEGQPGLSSSRVRSHLAKAVEMGDLLKEYGVYFSPDYKEDASKINKASIFSYAVKVSEPVVCEPNKEMAMDK